MISFKFPEDFEGFRPKEMGFLQIGDVCVCLWISDNGLNIGSCKKDRKKSSIEMRYPLPLGRLFLSDGNCIRIYLTEKGVTIVAQEESKENGSILWNTKEEFNFGDVK